MRPEAGTGRSKMSLDLMDVKNWDEIIVMVAEAGTRKAGGYNRSEQRHHDDTRGRDS